MPRRKGHRQVACPACLHSEQWRIDYLLARGGGIRPVAARYGIAPSVMHKHFHEHISEHYKKIASRFNSLEELEERCVEGDAETLDILGVLIRGHMADYSIARECGNSVKTIRHSNRVQALLELRCKITRELAPGPSLTVNNYVLRDAVEIVNALRQHPDAQQSLVDWYEARNSTKVIEHAAAD